MNIIAKRLIATGNVTTRNATLHGSVHDQNATAGKGQVTFKNKDTAGNIQHDITVLTGLAFRDVPIPGGGIPCPDGIHLDVMTNMDSVVVYYSVNK